MLNNDGLNGATTSNLGATGSQDGSSLDGAGATEQTREQLLNELNQLRGIYQNLAPYADAINEITDPANERLRKLLADKEQREYALQAVESYEDLKRKRAPAVPAELAPLDAKLTKVDKFIDELRDRETQANKLREQEAYRTNYAFAQALVKDRPEFATNNYAAINMLTNYAVQNGLSLEDAYKQNVALFTVPERRETPPDSLRADAGQSGIPARGGSKVPQNPAELKELVAGRLRRSGMGGA